MSVFKTLKDLQKQAEEAAPKSSGPKKNYLTIKAGDSRRIRFLQELTGDATRYDEEIGLVTFVNVHTSPFDFRKKLACTAESEEHDNLCYACEQAYHNAEEGWKRPRMHALFNVAVLNSAGDWELAVLDQTFGKNHIVNDLVSAAEEFGGITGRSWKFSRTGSGPQDTSYSILPLAEDVEDGFEKTFDLYDLSTQYRTLPYREQQKFFTPDGGSGDDLSKWTAE